MTVRVNNPTGVPQSVTLAGSVLTASCIGGATGYAATVICGVGTTDCLTTSGLTSGIWTHQVSVGAQNQFSKSIVVDADPNGIPNTISWVVFSTVLSVDRTDDVATNPTPQCPSAPGTQTCTLRQAMSAGATAAAPLLIQFDPTVFPAGTPTTIQLTQSTRLAIAGAQMTIDGTDPNGDPTFPGDPYNRIVLLPANGATFVFSNQGARLAGLFLQRALLADGATPGDIITFNGSGGQTQQNVVANCKIDGGGSSLTTKSTAHDCVEGFGGAGLNWSSANLIQNTELTACPDKGVKATTLAYLTVQDSWVHHNIGGGIQATLSGNVEADRNVIEFNGYNATVQVFTNGNGVAANGANAVVAPTTPDTPSVLQTNGNVLRNNSSRGISVQELSDAVITNDFTCGATNSAASGQNGIAIFNSTTSPASAIVRGTASVYNGRNGATITDQSTGDFGQTSPDGGNNAFTQNATNAALGGHNFDNSTSPQTTLPAPGNQWQHCYADPANPAATCDGNISLDINGPVSVSPPQPYRADGNTLTVVIQSFAPTKATAGDLVRITGSGFNAIDGYPPGGDCTTTVQQSNSCNPIAGTCVQYEASPEQWVDLPVQAVTPAEIVVRMPPGTTCAQPVTVRVQRLDDTGAIVTGTKTFCTNS
ncbi:MAG TPA: hypothetical protein VF515_15980 [Candidatus Binatia bacterium]